jgi:glycyl-tRNA synthetase alpha chain
MKDGRPLSLQEMILDLSGYWSRRGAVIHQPYDLEVGAGTMHPETFFRALGPEPWRVAYCQPSRRPVDGRYGDNPMRVYEHFQFQVLLKPSPPDVQEQYLDSLRSLGIEHRDHDIRFEEDNWEAPTLGAAGVGWQVTMDGMEISQFTYFQQVGGVDLAPISVELTYGLERICMFLGDVKNIFDIPWAAEASWAPGGVVPYGTLRRRAEREQSAYSFEEADSDLLRRHFEDLEGEARRLLEAPADARSDSPVPGPLLLPAYECTLRCSHLFNQLDARGAISVTQRAAYIQRIRRLALRCARAWLETREAAAGDPGESS